MSQQTETQQWQIDGAQMRYINAMLAQGGMTPQWQYAGNGSYVLVIVVPAGWDLPTYLDGQRSAPRRRPWWHLDVGRWLPVALLLAIVGATLYLLAYGAPAALASAMPDMPVIELPEIKFPEIVMPEWAPQIELPDVGGAVQGAVDAAMAPVNAAIATTMQIVSAVAMLAVGLVVLWLLFTFRGTISGIGGGVWKAGGAVAGAFAKAKGKAK